jgi:putative ABC transport system permease protein
VVIKVLLTRKLVRDIMAAKWQFAAVSILVLLGVASFIGSYGGYLNLRTSYDHTYRELNMADYWVQMNKLPLRAAAKVNAIPGVTAEGRIVRDIQVSIDESSPEKVVGRVVSLPGTRQPLVNQVMVEEGSYFSGSNAREVLLHRSFAQYYGIKPGEQITLKLGSLKARFRVAGIVGSPEYLWIAKSAQEPMPSPRSFGVIFMPQERAEKLFNMRGFVNELVLQVDRGAETAATLDMVGNVLRKYDVGRLEFSDEPLSMETRKRDIIRGYQSARIIPRKDQTSEKLLRMDLDAFSGLALLFPILFLSMAALTIYMLLGRLIQAQRPQIGVLKAMGYSRRQVLAHYLNYAVFIGISSSALGAVIGSYIAGIFAQEYARALNIPFVQVETHWQVIAVGILVAVAISIAAGLLQARPIASMRPAQSLRPPLPGGGAGHLLERLLPVPGWLPMSFKLALRNILRSPYRSLFQVVGVASAVSLVLVSVVFLDSFEQLLNLQFNHIQRYDAKVVFKNISSAGQAIKTGRWSGVSTSEPILEVPYRFRHGNRSQDSMLIGLPPKRSLYHLFEGDKRAEMLAPGRLLLTPYFRKQLQVKVGDTVQLEPLLGAIGEKQVVVGGFVEQPMGNAGYLPLKEVQALLKAPGTATALLLDLSDDEPPSRLVKKLYDLPVTEAVEFKAETRRFLDELMGFFYAFIGFMVAFGVALGATIIFSGVTVSVEERLREMGTLRTIGMGIWQIAIIITVESLILSSAGIALGLPLGNWLAASFLDLYQAEEFSFTMIIFPRTYLFTVVGLVTVMLLSELPSLRRLGRLNLAAIIKRWAE